MARKQTIKQCQNCNEEYSIRGDRSSQSKYCSKKCKQIASRTQIVSTCANCNKSFAHRMSRARIFCGRDCQYDYKHITSRITLICAACNKEFRVFRFESKKRTYCSMKCWYSNSNGERSGEHHPGWKGGHSEDYRYGPDWPKISYRVRKRDGWICQICSKYSKARGKYAHQVHHIVPLRKFNGDIDAAHSLENLITLCTSCHRRVETGKLKCPVPNANA